MVNRWAGRAARALDIPADVFGESRVSIVGTRRLLVENHRGLVHFSTGEIVVRVPSGQLVVRGRGLVIGAIQPDWLRVDGKIEQVVLTGGAWHGTDRADG
ncbi:MAG: sporulation protein YqfC [Limnochordaceae bacterium]|uniref:YabP/YqfC family sporulation protein n=1 Tax=Carboxydichorda subterranea TaxID=3109565 RepID=A0ABZ1BZM8_9FIRM|nr:YabP/YqfC family sporulation protein [Limnochorda sp. L945t]MBE3598193.1 sporulation protein YqfC [Limnochordaceae bacterium]WRP18281.1 YabP/YqfC family sporulation protein [Limnochorda sp. L945t]